jgi:hypothetical protein
MTEPLPLEEALPVKVADAAAVVRAYLRGDAGGFEAMIPGGPHDETLLLAFGIACELARGAAGSTKALDKKLALFIEAQRQ